MRTLLEQLFTPSPQASAVTSYGDFGWSDGSWVGQPVGDVSAETAMKVSAFFAGVRLLSFVVGRLPIGIFLNGTRNKDSEHLAYRLLAKRPNATATPFQFKQWMFSNVLRWGNSYAYIKPTAAEVSLMPIHPSLVEVEQLRSGVVQYKLLRSSDEVPRTIPQVNMMHWRSPFGDGLEGKSVLSYAQDVIRGSRFQQEYSNKQFSQGLLHKFATKLPPGVTMSEAAQQSLKQQLNDKAGISESHRVLVLPGGMELTPMTMSMADAQFLQQQEFSMVQVAQFLGIPPHMLELVSRSTSWGSGIEQQAIGFNVYTMDPWLTDLEESIDRDLLDSGATHYCKFNRKALMAADSRSRVAYYQGMVGIKAMVPNEVRDAEDMDPVAWGDEPMPAPNESPDRRVNDGGQAMAIAEEAAGRLIRKEIARITHLHKRMGTDKSGFVDAVSHFYGEHVEDVAQSMRLSPEDALEYCAEQRDAVLGQGIGVMEGWESERTVMLARRALGWPKEE